MAGIGDTAPAAPGHLKEDLTRYAKDKMDAARDRAGSLIEEHKTAAADELADVSGALRQASEHLRTRSRSIVAGFAQTTADQIETLAEAIRDRDLTELIADAQRLARRQPEVFFAGALVFGFLFARTLRSARPAAERTPEGGDR